ncbi:hypothetical protein NQ166_09375 [Microbacterium sp. zg.Y1090]|uniref:hypothetical protein n=1 Tax=Microbacterium TaxID=33882 RepID=UPI00214CDA3A|nr:MULTISPECIES: hypothetical protein [unclassified Microbacterium]MCR2811541.1 hypothetical protein [Microbacterium sp. zg.Y1084]MCR2819037.1 hypothetical protein [Microbacterium sp. zg.Y1090]MDL5487687.1 hypothetical protein [Microbacterium sp. zg-Y1211]WIM27341.1 hypothetical protein QNO26_09185 [Microbacterium sp. zg-Y1090]
MKALRVTIVIVVVIAWVAAAGSLITAFVDLSSLPAFARGALGLWPDPGTPASLAVRFGAIGVVVAGIVALRVLGKAMERRNSSRAAAEA